MARLKKRVFFSCLSIKLLSIVACLMYVWNCCATINRNFILWVPNLFSLVLFFIFIFYFFYFLQELLMSQVWRLMTEHHFQICTSHISEICHREMYVNVNYSCLKTSRSGINYIELNKFGCVNSSIYVHFISWSFSFA